MAIKNTENTRKQRAGTERSKEDLNPPKRVLPRVKFTGQQPGEEGVERDLGPGPDDVKDENGREDKKDEDGEEIVPIKEPSTEGKFSA